MAGIRTEALPDRKDMSFRELPGTPKSTVGNAEVEVQFYKAEIEAARSVHEGRTSYAKSGANRSNFEPESVICVSRALHGS